MKLQNILLKDPNGNSILREMTVKITDYNVSKWSPDNDRTATQTAWMGSASYRAPEVLLARDDQQTHYDTPCDIWAVGVLVFHLWTRETFVTEDEIRSDQLDVSY